MAIPAIIELSALDGINGTTFNAIDPNIYYSVVFGVPGGAGAAVASLGDINGDGFGDLAIGAWAVDLPGDYGYPRVDAGQTYVVFGRSGGLGADLDLSALDGSNGFTLNGIRSSGFSIAGVGDINGDGIRDLLIGAPAATGFPPSGESYVVFGRSGSFDPVIELSNLDGNNGFTVFAAGVTDQSGYSVAGVGDINGDGMPDFAIGAPSANGEPTAHGPVYAAGKTYIVFGRSGGFGAELQLSALDSLAGLIINGTNLDDFSGASVAAAGDVNHDGVDDIIIGGPSTFPAIGRGNSFVVFGNSASLPGSLDLSALDGANGFTLQGGERLLPRRLLCGRGGRCERRRHR